MNKVIDYRIEYGHTIYELENKVNLSISEGWTPQGGIAVVSGEISIFFGQAMVRYE